MTEKRDPELENLLSTLRSEDASPFELRRWKRAISEEASRKNGQMRRWGFEVLKVGVAAGIGFVIGAATLHHLNNSISGFAPGTPVTEAPAQSASGVQYDEISPDTATSEMIHIKLD